MRFRSRPSKLSVPAIVLCWGMVGFAIIEIFMGNAARAAEVCLATVIYLLIRETILPLLGGRQ